MPGKQAKTLSSDHVDDLLFFANHTRHPLRNRLIVLLSLKAGLRASEIARLTWDMLLTPSGEIGQVLEIRDSIAKKQSGRRIPLHQDLSDALASVWRSSGCVGPVIRSERGGPMTPLSIVVWFDRAFERSALTAARHIRAAERLSRVPPGGPQSRRFAARRSAACRSSIDPDDAAVHRRRQRRATEAGIADIATDRSRKLLRTVSGA